MMGQKNYDAYQTEYSQNKLFDKILLYAKELGAALVYKALQLYYVTRKPDVPVKVKTTIYGALGYLILPLDFVPDLLPVAGYGDDAVAIAFALAVAHMYIDDAVREKAKVKIVSIFGQGVMKIVEG
ncbi:MAG: hypothetical protein H6Q65_2388 [Firmicutes bacterium]|nr:hypothetical protein [Bacillota bacterium]